MTQPARFTMLILVFAFIVSILTHGVLVMMLSQHPVSTQQTNLDTIRTVCYTVATAGILTSVYWSLLKIPSAPNALKFQTEMILALAFSEIASVAGMLLFFLAHKPSEFWPFGIAALIVDVVFILPRVLQRA